MRHSLEMLEARLLLAVQPLELDWAGQETEPNDTIETATPLARIALGMPCHLEDAAAICPADVFSAFGQLGGDSASALRDVDYFSLPIAAANSRVVVHIDGPVVRHGAAFALVAADGTVLAQAKATDRDGDGVVDGALIEYGARTSGDLFLRISPMAPLGREGLEYSVSASVRVDRNLEHEPNDTFETANEVALVWHSDASDQERAWLPIQPAEAFGFIRGELDNGSTAPDSDFFHFSVRASATVNVRVEGLGAEAGHLTIYDSAHEIVAEGSPDAEGHLGVTFEAASGDDFFAQLTDKGTVVCITAPCLTYALEIRARQQIDDPYAEQEPNNSLETANVMREMPLAYIAAENDPMDALGVEAGLACVDCGVVISQLYVARGDFASGTDIRADRDYYSVAVEASRKITVTVQGAVPIHLQLLDSSGKLLDEVTGTADQRSAAVSYFAQESGKFYILVEPSDASFVADDSHYSVRALVRPEPHVEHEPNDSIATANSVALFPRCEVVCVLANTPGATAASEDGTALEPATSSLIRVGGVRQTGYVVGRADLQRCPAEASCELPFLTGDDFFSVAIGAKHDSRATLTGALARLGGAISLYDENGVLLATDDDNSDGLLLTWNTTDAGTFFISVRISEEGLAKLTDLPCDRTTAAGDCPATGYRLDVVSAQARNPVAGHDEQEPNDTIATANELELRVFPTLAPGIELRGGAAHGIAGGPTSDQDAYYFEVQAGEHVTVDVQGLLRDDQGPRPLEVWLHDNNYNEFGDALGTTYRHGVPRFANDFEAIADRVQQILVRHPDVQVGHFEVTVYDSSGAVIGSTKSGDAGALSFDADADATYYAIVRAIDSSIVDEPGHYRLGVLARSHFEEELVKPPGGSDGAGSSGEIPAVIEIDAGDRFRYTDKSGDEVEIYLRGRTGTATITFSNSDPDGSDIASVEIVGVRRGGSLTIQTDGSAEVGAIEIRASVEGARRRGQSNAADFKAVEVDGNVGILSTDVNLRSLIVGGVLGDIAAQGLMIRQLQAEVFDSALADVGTIRSIEIDKETADSLFEILLPWDPPPSDA